MGEHRRVFLNQELSAGQELCLPVDAVHHLVHVLRLKPGDPLVAISEQSGNSFDAIVVALSPATIKVLTKRSSQKLQSPVGALCLALLKGDSVDLVVEKTTELGAARIILWKAARSIPVIKDPAKRLERWQKIARSASLQCQRTEVPEISLAGGLEEALNMLPQRAGYFCSLSPETQALRALDPSASPAAFWIGPEGDFTAEEEALLKKRGATPITLGPLTLRSETAAIAVVASVQALWGRSFR